MLSAIRRYMEERPTATLADVAAHVGADTDAVRGMIDHWIRKGRIGVVPLERGACTQCDPATIETYRWLGKHDGAEPTSTPPVATQSPMASRHRSESRG